MQKLIRNLLKCFPNCELGMANSNPVHKESLKAVLLEKGIYIKLHTEFVYRQVTVFTDVYLANFEHTFRYFKS